MAMRNQRGIGGIVAVIAAAAILIVLVGCGLAHADSWNSDGQFDRVWYEDTSQSPLSVTHAAANQPGHGNILGSSEIECELFAGTGAMEQILFTTQLPHSFDGVFLKPHVHAMPTTAGAGDYQFHIEYSAAQPFAAFPSTSTASSDVRAAGGTAWVHQVTGWTTSFVPSGYNDSSTSMIITGRIYRDPADGDDTYEADVCLLDFDFHYSINSPGSREEYIK